MKECFVISPIGKEGSDIRKNADQVFKYIIKPAMDECKMKATRSDQIDKPGKITDQMFQLIHTADLCIADLTNHNPNVFYELAIAQSANRPVIILIRKGETLPFDVSDLRCIYYDLDIDSYNEKIYINKVINYINEFEAAGWKAPDLFGLYVPAYTNDESEIVDFDDIKNQLEKTIIYKMINLKSVDESPDVIYERYIPRVKKKIGVTSEFMAIRINKFDKKVNHFKSRDRTSGDAIEVNALLPFHFGLEDTDKKAELIQPIISGPSNVYVSTAHTYNGFKIGELDIGTKAEKNTDLVRLIIDFSSIPDFNKLISETPKLHYCPFSDNSDLKEEEHKYEIKAHGIYLTEKTNMKKEDVLRFDFFIKEK